MIRESRSHGDIIKFRPDAALSVVYRITGYSWITTYLNGILTSSQFGFRGKGKKTVTETAVNWFCQLCLSCIWRQRIHFGRLFGPVSGVWLHLITPPSHVNWLAMVLPLLLNPGLDHVFLKEGNTKASAAEGVLRLAYIWSVNTFERAYPHIVNGIFTTLILMRGMESHKAQD